MSELIDQENNSRTKRRGSIDKLITGGSLIGVSVLIIYLVDFVFVINGSLLIWLNGIAIVGIVFGIMLHVIGFIYAFAERKNEDSKWVIGLIGNLVVLLFFVLMIAYIVITIVKWDMGPGIGQH